MLGCCFYFWILGCLEILGILAGLGDKRQFEDLLEFPRNGKLWFGEERIGLWKIGGQKWGLRQRCLEPWGPNVCLFVDLLLLDGRGVGTVWYSKLWESRLKRGSEEERRSWWEAQTGTSCFHVNQQRPQELVRTGWQFPLSMNTHSSESVMANAFWQFLDPPYFSEGPTSSICKSRGQGEGRGKELARTAETLVVMTIVQPKLDISLPLTKSCLIYGRTDGRTDRSIDRQMIYVHNIIYFV